MDQSIEKQKQLDLSDFPKIIEPDQSEAIKQRSQGLAGIRDAMENVMKLLEAYFNELLEIDKQARILDQEKVGIKQAEFDLYEKEKKIAVREQDLKKQQEYIDNTNLSLKEREMALAEDKNYIIEIEQAKLAYEDRKSEALRQEAVVDEKTKRLDTLAERQKKLDDKETVLERSADIDAERKRLLDLREERIKGAELRLHLDRQE